MWRLYNLRCCSSNGEAADPAGRTLCAQRSHVAPSQQRSPQNGSAATCMFVRHRRGFLSWYGAPHGGKGWKPVTVCHTRSHYTAGSTRGMMLVVSCQAVHSEVDSGWLLCSSAAGIASQQHCIQYNTKRWSGQRHNIGAAPSELTDLFFWLAACNCLGNIISG